MKEEDDQDEDEEPETATKLAKVLRKKQREIEKVNKSEETFVKADKRVFEEQEFLSERKEIWDWMVLCFKGEKKNLFCVPLVRKVAERDISQLFTQVKNFRHTKNNREYGTKLDNFDFCKPQKTNDIFSLVAQLDKYEKELERMEHLALEVVESMILPKFYMVHKILTGVDQFPNTRYSQTKYHNNNLQRDQTHSRANQGKTTPHKRKQRFTRKPKTLNTYYTKTQSIITHTITTITTL